MKAPRPIGSFALQLTALVAALALPACHKRDADSHPAGAIRLATETRHAVEVGASLEIDNKPYCSMVSGYRYVFLARLSDNMVGSQFLRRGKFVDATGYWETPTVSEQKRLSQWGAEMNQANTLPPTTSENVLYSDGHADFIAWPSLRTDMKFVVTGIVQSPQ